MFRSWIDLARFWWKCGITSKYKKQETSERSSLFDSRAPRSYLPQFLVTAASTCQSNLFVAISTHFMAFTLGWLELRDLQRLICRVSEWWVWRKGIVLPWPMWDSNQCVCVCEQPCRDTWREEVISITDSANAFGWGQWYVPLCWHRQGKPVYDKLSKLQRQFDLRAGKKTHGMLGFLWELFEQRRSWLEQRQGLMIPLPWKVAHLLQPSVLQAHHAQASLPFSFSFPLLLLLLFFLLLLLFSLFLCLFGC